MENQEFMACNTCGVPGTVVGHKDYNVAGDGTVTETLVWQCGDPSKLHRWETVNTHTVNAAVVPPAPELLDPHLHQDKNFANLNQPNQSDLPVSASYLNPDYSETNAHTEDGITIQDGTEGPVDENQEYNQDGSIRHEGETEFSDTRTPAAELTADGSAVNGTEEDQTFSEARTTKTRSKKATPVAKADPRPDSDTVANASKSSEDTTDDV